MAARVPVPGGRSAIVCREEDMFVAVCPELDVASQGFSYEHARENLIEAIELFLECASPEEIEQRKAR